MKNWSESLQSNEGSAKMFKIAKQMRKERKNIVGTKYARDKNGTYKNVEKLFFFFTKRGKRVQLNLDYPDSSGPR